MTPPVIAFDASRRWWAGTWPLILVTTESSRDNPLFTVTLQEVPRGTPTRAACEHHRLCWARIDRRGNVNHITPSAYERSSGHISCFRRDNLNPGRELLRNGHREPISSIHRAGKTRRTKLRTKKRDVEWSHAPVVAVWRVAQP